MSDFKSKEIIYIAYLLFCKKHGIKPDPEEIFYKKVLQQNSTFRIETISKDEVFVGGYIKKEVQEEIFREINKLKDLPEEIPTSEQDFYLYLRILKNKLQTELSVNE